jgi:hypothetical protein
MDCERRRRFLERAVSRYSPQSRSRGRHLLNPTPRLYHASLFGFRIPEKGSVPSSSYLDVSAGGQFFATASSKRRWGYFTTGKTRPRGHILPLIMPASHWSDHSCQSAALVPIASATSGSLSKSSLLGVASRPAQAPAACSLKAVPSITTISNPSKRSPIHRRSG